MYLPSEMANPISRPVPACRSSRGMGAVVSADGTDITYPWYCSLVPALVSGSDCAPATTAQIQAMAQAQLAQVAAVNPDLAASALAQGSAATSALASSDPADAAAYNASVNSPTLSSLFGTDLVNWVSGINPDTGLPDPTGQYVMYALIAVGAVIVVGALK